MRSRLIQLADTDDVAVLIDDARAGERVGGIEVRDLISAGHKIALHDIAMNAAVHKYGQVIGLAGRDIKRGEHVHVHNLVLGEAQQGQGTERSAAAPPRPGTDVTFAGYRRDDGRVGTRNFIGVVSSVNCSATVSRRIAAAFDAPIPGIDGVAAFTHQSGCGLSKSGEGFDVLERTLGGYARHANFGGMLLVGLGCEVAQIEGLMSRFGLSEGRRLRTLTIQDAGGTMAAIERGKQLVLELIEEASVDRRSACPVAELTLGLQCGGSDSWSGVTANPALGFAADLIVAEGGTVILSETPEIFGAEHLLLRRAATSEVADALLARLRWWQNYAERNGASLDNNPSPGNKAGGLTTIFEKSLGAVAKAGTSPLMDVSLYAQPPQSRGLVFMDSPGFDPCSATGQIAAGANILAFTTGRGSTFGSKPAPCLKIASNAELARRMAEDVDADCSPMLDGMPVATAGQMLFAQLVAVASGFPTKSEALGLGDHEFVPWQLGAWL